MTELTRIRSTANHLRALTYDKAADDVERLIKALEKCRDQRDIVISHLNQVMMQKRDLKVEFNAELASILGGEGEQVRYPEHSESR